MSTLPAYDHTDGAGFDAPQHAIADLVHDAYENSTLVAYHDGDLDASDEHDPLEAAVFDAQRRASAGLGRSPGFLDASDEHDPLEAAVFDAQRRASAGLGRSPGFESLSSFTTALSFEDIDADESELDVTLSSATQLATLFPVIDGPRIDALADDVVCVSNVDIVHSIVARGLSIHDDDLNPDPLLCVPSRIAERVVSRPSRLPAPGDVAPRRSVRIAMRKTTTAGPSQSTAPSTSTVQRKPTTSARRYQSVAAQPSKSVAHKKALPTAAAAPSWSFQHHVHATPSTSLQQLSPPPPAQSSPSYSPPSASSPLPACSSPPPASHQTSSPPVSSPPQSSPPRVPPTKRKRKRSLRNAAARKRRMDDAGIVTAADDAEAVADADLPACSLSSTTTSASSSVAVSEFSFQIAPFLSRRTSSSTRQVRVPPPASSSVPNAPSVVERAPQRRHHSSAYYEARRHHYHGSLVLESYTPRYVEGVQGRAALSIEEVNRSKPGWQGAVPRRRIREVLSALYTPQFSKMLEIMTLLPYHGLNTMVCDMERRGVLFRSTPVRDHGDEDIVDLFCSDARDLAKRCPITDGDRNANSRGRHWHCIAGVHRQFAKHAYYTKFQVKYSTEISHFFRHNGPADRITRYLTSLLRSRFPAIVARMEANHRWHFNNSKHLPEPLVPQFGLFWNFCVNVPLPRQGVPRVFCLPHADRKNCAVSLCALFFFWPKELLHEDEWSWLVVWELGIILQCPRGSFVLYPSALLFHFNIRIVKCKKGTRPTPDNSDEIVLDNKGGRGSAVWFTQATMLSVTDERDASSGHLPNYEELARMCFPLLDHDDALPPEDGLLDEL